MNGQIIDTHISGIPCKVEVTYFLVVSPWKGPAHTCPSSDDYYGFEEIEFDVLDRKGYKADWLERKMTDADVDRIHSEIMQSWRNSE